MATLTYTNAFADTWSDLSWWGFSISATQDHFAGDTVTRTLTLSPGPGTAAPYDQIDIVLTFDSLADLHAFEEGSAQGAGTLTGGTLDSITYRQASTILVTMEDLPDHLVPYLSSLTHTGDEERFGQALSDLDTLYVGSGNGAEDTWDTSPADRIFTGRGDDQVNAKGGHDTIYDFGGKDFYNGAKGQDMVSYNQYWWSPIGISQGITADLAASEIIGPDGKRDRVKNIEQVEGTFLNDVILGDAQANLFAGYGGADHFDGRAGTDMLDYSRDASQNGLDGIRVDMSAGTLRDGFGFTDTFQNIEQIGGTYARDAFADDDSDMYYEGRGGDDVFRIRGGLDRMIGGEGADTFNFIGTDFGENFIQDWEPGTDILSINKLTDESQLNIFQVEANAIVVFSVGADSSSIVFENTDIAVLTWDVFGL